MFVLARLRDSVRLHPRDFHRQRDEAVADELQRKYSNRVVHSVGLCICLFDLISLSDALVVPGDGCVHLKVEFRFVVFRPFIGEILPGKVRQCSEKGVHVGIGFFEEVVIPPLLLQDNSHFDASENVWVWKYQNQHNLFMDVGEPIRFRVHAETFVDTMPASDGGAISGTAGAGAGPATANGATEAVGAGMETTMARRNAAQLGQQHPYSIQGSIQEDGLGLVSWWPS